MTPFETTGAPSSGQPHNGHDGHRIGERVEHIGDSAQELWSQARGMVQDINQALDLPRRIEQHPYATLAVAAGVGYVLGGGLFTPLTGKLFRLGMRLAALPLVRNELLGLAGAVEGYGGPSYGPGGSSPQGV